ncbi:MAG: histone deacetylase [Limnobacter sp.]|nr:histone deacetylase [Limnobacter sp.]
MRQIGLLLQFMDVFYTDQFVLPLPKGHRFPMQKYSMLRQSLQNSAAGLRFHEPRPCSRGELALAHCPHYVENVHTGQLSCAQQKLIGFPWSEAMVERSLRSVGATLEAVFAAVQNGASVNLAGGTHHAKKASGAGFCVFNDQAVAARAYQAHALASGGKEPKVLVVDLDVHQGDGTAEICRSDDSIFTFSMHGQSNFPFEKETSDLDIELASGTGDEEYLQKLNAALEAIAHRFTPDLILYVAGHDSHESDRLGRLALTDQGMVERNRVVFNFASRFSCPIAMSMAGGYFPDLQHLVEVQTSTILQLLNWVESSNSLEQRVTRTE